MLERSNIFYSLRHKKNEGENWIHLGKNVKDVDSKSTMNTKVNSSKTTVRRIC